MEISGIWKAPELFSWLRFNKIATENARLTVIWNFNGNIVITGHLQDWVWDERKGRRHWLPEVLRSLRTHPQREPLLAKADEQRILHGRQRNEHPMWNIQHDERLLFAWYDIVDWSLDVAVPLSLSDSFSVCLFICVFLCSVSLLLLLVIGPNNNRRDYSFMAPLVAAYFGFLHLCFTINTFYYYWFVLVLHVFLNPYYGSWMRFIAIYFNKLILGHFIFLSISLLLLTCFSNTLCLFVTCSCCVLSKVW